MSAATPPGAPSSTATAAAPEPVSLKAFLLGAMLWLPLAFFLWFTLRTAIVYPVIRAAAWVLELLVPGTLVTVQQEYHEMLFGVVAEIGQVGNLPAHRLQVDLGLNVLPYCYGIPVLMGLSIATPIGWSRTFLQLAIGVPVLWLLQTFGVVGEVLKKLLFELGPAVHAALVAEGYPAEAPLAAANAAQHAARVLGERGLGAEAIALWYQFGFLILPSIGAVILWILLNRDFIEGIRRPPPPPAEPSAASGGLTGSDRT